jgi:hypothetical protein
MWHVLCALALLAVACDVAPESAAPSVPTQTSSDPAGDASEATAPQATEELPNGVSDPPHWLGKRVLPVGENGLGIARRTPKALRDRRLATVDVLPPPESDRFTSSVGPVPRGVLRRSTWSHRCPIGRRDLAYVLVSFWGFDQTPHTGELLVHRSVARDVVSVFRTIYRQRWPIEEMRVTTRAELDAPPTGDGNNTGAFVCRPARLSQEWSQHAYGLAIDVNPFHNPYVGDDFLLPERALAYGNRGWRRPGMIFGGDVVTRAFGSIGWGWGGEWVSTKDWMHFSRSGA